ncbi:MAG TPA: phasin family protein [Vicinamibacteria bacterium]|nr:phasin family protein [Vicinamibacteria bacterium]
MAKRKTVRRKVTPRKRAVRRAARPVALQGRLKRTWSDALATVTEAEARAEREVRGLLKRNRISTRDAATMLKDLRSLVDRERKKGMKELDARLAGLQARVRKERKNAAKMVEDAVQGALATFNVPSRQEVRELTRKVNELSRKIDSFRR